MIKYLTKYLLNNKTFVVALVVLILLASVFAQLTPYIQGIIVDTAAVKDNFQIIINLSVIFAIIYILDAICKYYLNLATSSVAYNASYNMRLDVFRGVLHKPYKFFETNKIGDILYRTNTYIYEIGYCLSKDISQLFYGFVRFLIIFAFILALDWIVALLLAFLYALIFIVIFIFSKILRKRALLYKQNELARNSLIMEDIAGIETFLAYNSEFDYLNNYENINNKYDKNRNKFYSTFHKFLPSVDFLVCLGTVIIYFLVYNYSLDIIELGVVVAVLTYSTRVLTPMEMIVKSLGDFFEISATVNEVFEYGKSDGKKQKLDIEFSKVDINCKKLTYIDENTNSFINNLTLSVPYGQHVLIYGRYGLGKTAFSNLLCGLYEPQRGGVFLNKTNINKLSSQTRSKLISVASDYVGIIEGSLKDNIKLANHEATIAQINQAIKFVGLEGYVKKLARGINTIISNSSIGESERQLIAFARIVLRNPKIIIIDEFCRDLDAKSQKQFLINLKRFAYDKTLIYINHNSNVDFEFDKIIAFEDINARKV